MLMALLPLAGWAEDLSTGTIIAPSPYFGVEPVATNVKVYNAANALLAVTTDYTFDGFFSDEACATAVTTAQIKAANAGTTFYVKVTGAGTYTGELKKAFTVAQMPLTVVVTDASKTYGDADPEDGFTVSSVKIDGGSDAPTAVKNAVVADRKPGEPAATYAYTATITGQPNYTIGSVTGTFTINPKGFVENTDVTVTVTANLTYNSKAQKATIVVKDKATGATLKENTDYTLTWANNIAACTDLTSTSAPKVTIAGKGNYKTDNIVKYFAIAKAPLLVTPAGTKEYDGYVGGDQNGTDGNEVEATFTYQGWVDATIPTVTVTDKKAYTLTDATKNVGEYAMTVAAANFSVAGNNYNFMPAAGVFKITQKTITVTATDANLEYGAAEDFVYTTSGEITGDANAVAKAFKVTKTEQEEADDTYDFDLVPSFRTAAEIDAAVDADDAIAAADKPAAKAAAKLIETNYKLTPVNGKLTYSAASLIIALKESAYTDVYKDNKLQKVYDGKKVSQSITLDKTNGLSIIGKKNDSDVINIDNLTLTVVSDAANQGTYQLTLAGATAENYNITYVPSTFEITKKDLKIKIFDQTFVKGQALNLNTELYEIDSEKGLASTDKVSEVFKLTTTVVASGDPEVITSTAGSYQINAENVGGSKSKYGNYNVTTVNALDDSKTYGVATVVDGTVVTLDDSKSLVDAAAKSADATGATITFSSRNLNAEKWNVLVLPFDIAVKDLAAAFDYAVIDVLDQTASDGNMHFKFAVTGDIKANTPFLLYPTSTYNNLNQVTFTGVTIEKGAMSKATVEVKDGSNNKLVGTYADTKIYGEKFYAMFGGEWGRLGSYTEAAPCTIKPLRAYIDLSASASSAPVIYIEEPNGNTTAIKTLDVETMNAYSTDGWYNLNGVKLNGVPTEKGIYINNGKKVVIK